MHKAELARLAHQLLPQIELPGSFPFGESAASQHDFRTYFITVTAYPDAAMHYNVLCTTPGLGLKALDALSKNPPGSSPPAGVK
jgi:hypothetical protein